MVSIRTGIHLYQTSDFRRFLDANGLGEVHLGSYKPHVFTGVEHICMAYSDKGKGKPIPLALSFLTLRYGSIDNAFGEYSKSPIRFLRDNQ